MEGAVRRGCLGLKTRACPKLKGGAALWGMRVTLLLGGGDAIAALEPAGATRLAQLLRQRGGVHVGPRPALCGGGKDVIALPLAVLHMQSPPPSVLIPSFPGVVQAVCLSERRLLYCCSEVQQAAMAYKISKGVLCRWADWQEVLPA